MNPRTENPRAMRRVQVKFHRDYFPPALEHAMAVSGPLYRAGETYTLPNSAAIALSGYCERVYDSERTIPESRS